MFRARIRGGLAWFHLQGVARQSSETPRGRAVVCESGKGLVLQIVMQLIVCLHRSQNGVIYCSDHHKQPRRLRRRQAPTRRRGISPCHPFPKIALPQEESLALAPSARGQRISLAPRMSPSSWGVARSMDVCRRNEQAATAWATCAFPLLACSVKLFIIAPWSKAPQRFEDALSSSEPALSKGCQAART